MQAQLHLMEVMSLGAIPLVANRMNAVFSFFLPYFPALLHWPKVIILILSSPLFANGVRKIHQVPWSIMVLILMGVPRVVHCNWLMPLALFCVKY